MKKYLSLVMIGLSLMLSGCNKDDNNDPDTPPTGDTGKVRYEATVSDPENFKLLIHYTVGVDISSEAPEEAAKETIVESPFTFEQEAKQGSYRSNPPGVSNKFSVCGHNKSMPISSSSGYPPQNWCALLQTRTSITTILRSPSRIRSILCTNSGSKKCVKLLHLNVPDYGPRWVTPTIGEIFILRSVSVNLWSNPELPLRLINWQPSGIGIRNRSI